MTLEDAANITRPFNAAVIAAYEARGSRLQRLDWAREDLRAEYVCVTEFREDLAKLDAMADVIVAALNTLAEMAATIQNAPKPDHDLTRLMVAEAYSETMMHPAAGRYLEAAVRVAK